MLECLFIDAFKETHSIITCCRKVSYSRLLKIMGNGNRLETVSFCSIQYESIMSNEFLYRRCTKTDAIIISGFLILRELRRLFYNSANNGASYNQMITIFIHRKIFSYSKFTDLFQNKLHLTYYYSGILTVNVPRNRGKSVIYSDLI